MWICNLNFLFIYFNFFIAIFFNKCFYLFLGARIFFKIFFLLYLNTRIFFKIFFLFIMLDNRIFFQINTSFIFLRSLIKLAYHIFVINIIFSILYWALYHRFYLVIYFYILRRRIVPLKFTLNIILRYTILITY
jgi:hypothetical protein